MPPVPDHGPPDAGQRLGEPGTISPLAHRLSGHPETPPDLSARYQLCCHSLTLTYGKATQQVARRLADVNRLRDDLTDDQRAVLRIIHSEFEESARWPIWQYIDLQIKPRGAAAAALASMPRLRDPQHHMGMTYGLVWWENYYAGPSQRTTVEMSVAGLHSLGCDELPELYVRMIRYLATEQAKLVTDDSGRVRRRRR